MVVLCSVTEPFRPQHLTPVTNLTSQIGIFQRVMLEPPPKNAHLFNFRALSSCLIPYESQKQEWKTGVQRSGRLCAGSIRPSRLFSPIRTFSGQSAREPGRNPFSFLHLRKPTDSVSVFQCFFFLSACCINSTFGSTLEKVSLSRESCVCFSVVSDSLWPCGLSPARLLCPWNSPGKKTRVGSHCQGIFPTQGQNLGLLHCRQILCRLSHRGAIIQRRRSMTTLVSHVCLWFTWFTTFKNQPIDWRDGN